MAYDEELAHRVRALLKDENAVTERRMFGGLAFLVRGNMSCGIVRNELMVRVGPEDYDAALQDQSARPMDFTGKPMRGFVYVRSAGIASDADLQRWVHRGFQYAASLLAK